MAHFMQDYIDKITELWVVDWDQATFDTFMG